MKISELSNKDYLGGSSGVGSNSYLIMNYDTEVRPNNGGDDPNPPVTYKVALSELGRFLIKDLKLVQYDNSSNRSNLNTLDGGSSSYTTSTIGQFISSADRTVLDDALTNVSYNSTSKKFQKSVRGGTASDIVTVATLKTDMELNNVNNTSDANKPVSTATQTALNLKANKADLSATITGMGAGKTLSALSETNGVISASFQNISIPSSQISDGNAANQVLKLNSSGLIDSTYLPSYVDDVLEGTLSTFPATGETGKIYVDTSTNTSYRWSGSQYTKIASSLSLGTTSSTAYRGDYGAAAYAHAVTNKGSAFASGFYKITTNSEGHVTATTAVTASDITSFLGTAAVKDIPASGDASTTEVVLGNDSRLTDERNAADVYAWAKAATKPTYTASEVGALPDNTEIPDITGLAPTEEPVFTNSITIGSTTITESQLQSLLALLEE